MLDAGGGIKPRVPGISTTGDSHFRTRSTCIQEMGALFPPLPARAVSSHPRAALLRLSPLLDFFAGLLPAPLERAGCLCGK